MTHSHSAASVPSRLALIGRIVGSSPCDPATLLVIDNQHQSTDGTERGIRSSAACRQYPAVADHLQDWPRNRAGMVTSNLLITGGGLGRPAFRRFNFRTQPTWQGIADVLPSHLKNSASNAGINKPREAGNEVPQNEAFGTHDDC